MVHEATGRAFPVKVLRSTKSIAVVKRLLVQEEKRRETDNSPRHTSLTWHIRCTLCQVLEREMAEPVIASLQHPDRSTLVVLDLASVPFWSALFSIILI